VIKITFTGLFATNFLPTTIGGDLVRVAGGLQLGYDPVKLSTSLLFDRLIGMVGMIIALPLNIFIPKVIKLLPENRNILINQIVIGSTIWKNLIEKTTNLVNKLLNTLKLWRNQPKAIIFSFISTIGHMICLFITIWCLFFIQKVNIPFSSVAGLWSLSYFFTLLPVSINGLGLQEISITYLYSTIGGASLESCLVTAIMIRILQSFASLPGALFLPSIMIKTEKINENR
jgi:glycosyltransferase 2 family protein